MFERRQKKKGCHGGGGEGSGQHLAAGMRGKGAMDREIRRWEEKVEEEDEFTYLTSFEGQT